MNSEDSGLYLLVIRLTRPIMISAGKLPPTQLEPGTYLYVGRAKKNLRARVERHIRAKKQTFWHIDYLLQHAHIKSVGIRHNAFDECEMVESLQKRVPGSRIPLARFGASDCRCGGHLLLIPEKIEAVTQLESIFSFEEVNP